MTDKSNPPEEPLPLQKGYRPDSPTIPRIKPPSEGSGSFQERVHRFPRSEYLALIKGPDGQNYSCHFYGENEGAAVITGPIPVGGDRLHRVPEVHREPASDPQDAAKKLNVWRKANGWPV